MLKGLKNQVEDRLQKVPQTRNDDALLIIELYREHFHLEAFFDAHQLRKLYDMMACSSPDDIVRSRRYFQSERRDKSGEVVKARQYVPTDPRIMKMRKMLEDKYKAELGYGGGSQAGAIAESQLNQQATRHIQETLI